MGLHKQERCVNCNPEEQRRNVTRVEEINGLLEDLSMGINEGPPECREGWFRKRSELLSELAAIKFGTK